MAQIEPAIPQINMPLSPTYMPYFEFRRSPSNSSSNTRQRDDYEQPLQLQHVTPPPSPAPTPSAVAWNDEEDEDEHPRSIIISDRSVEGYPAWELPFASEPALETELEQELPPLKKIKSANCPDDQHDIAQSPSGLIVMGAIKGILTRREGDTSGCNTPASTVSRPMSPLALESCFSPWPLGIASSSLGVTSRSRPVSRRSSSGASSSSAGTSIKAVRFVSGNGIFGPWTGSEPLVKEIEGPVAAVMYLTHSADAYDRSPIIVEDGLRLPPRAKKDDDDGGGWVTCQSASSKSKKGSCTPQRLARLSVETIRPVRPLQLRPAVPLCSSPTDTDGSDSQESSLNGGASNQVQPDDKPSPVKKCYREVIEDEEEEEEEETEADRHRKEDEEDDGADDGNQHQEESADEDEDRRIISGLGQWTTADAFGCCDALGGF